MKKSIFITGFTVLSIAFACSLSQITKAASYIFPVIGSVSYSNDYDAMRGSEKHNAIDIIASKGQQIVSATDGKIINVMYPQPSWGNAVTILGNDNYCYWYLHINNDNPGTDDGKGGPMRAYAPDMNPGNPVKKGQLIGWVGDSGNAESTVSHLHFEVVKADTGRSNPCGYTSGVHLNPYNSLRSATHISKSVDYPALPNEVLPFGSKFKGGVNVAISDVSGDGVQDYIVGAGSGGGPRVNIYDSSRHQIITFYAFDPTVNRIYGVDVSAGDIDGDGKNEIITGARTPDGPRIAVYKLTEGVATKVNEFSTFQGLQGGVSVSSGDLDADGKAEIIVGAGSGGGPRVNVFGASGNLLSTAYVYSTTFHGGVDVAVGDVTGDGGNEIVTTPLSAGSSRVRIFNASLQPLSEFYAYGTVFRGGVRVAVGDVETRSPKQEIVTVPGLGSPDIKHFNYSGQQINQQHFFLEQWWNGYYDVAAGNGQGKHAVGIGINRRAAVRY